MSDWIEVKAVFEHPPEDWSTFADAFDRHGCPGSLQTDNPPALSGYLAAVEGVEGRCAALVAELKDLGARKVETQLTGDQDWSEMWKRFFKVRRIGERIVVRPTWEAYEPGEKDIVIHLDPGMAFGTGDHPTTRLCLELMEGFDLQCKAVADVGCGSGILSIAAIKLGARSVVASDIDPGSVAVARENARLNGLKLDAVVAPGFDAVPEPVDIVLSNIISATLIKLAHQAASTLHTGGIWIVSGIIEQNWPDVQSAAEREGFKLVNQVKEDDWIAAAFRL